MSYTLTWTLKVERSGQPRAYADHQTVGTITLTGDWYGKAPDFGRGLVRSALKGMVPFTHDNEDSEFNTQPQEFHHTYLDYLRKIGPGEWEFRVVQPFLD